MTQVQVYDHVREEELPESDLWWYLDKAVFDNRLAIIAVTSAAQGAIQADGFKFGQGKSFFAMSLNRDIHKRAYHISTKEAEEKVKGTMGYSLDDVKIMLKTGREHRHVAWVQDDWQISAGKHMSHDRGLKHLAGILSSARPYVAVIITTQPELGDIAKCMRELYMFEIKVPQRGLLEVQMLQSWTKFNDPLNQYKKLVPISQSDFPPVSRELSQWYDGWRDEHFNQQLDQWIDEYLEPNKDKKEGNNIICIHCQYEWHTNSQLEIITCPSCRGNTRNPNF